MTNANSSSAHDSEFSNLLQRARAARNANDEQATPLFEQAYQRAVQSNDLAGQAVALNGLAELDHMQGNSARAVERLTVALDVRRRLLDASGEVKALTNLGTLLTDLGDYPPALQHLLAALQLLEAQREEEPSVAFGVYANLARLYDASGHHEHARTYYQRALHSAERWNHRPAHAFLAVSYGDFLRQQGDLPHAEHLYRESLHLSDEIATSAAFALHGLGLIHARHGDLQAALDAHEKSVAVARLTADVDAELEALAGQAQTLLLAQRDTQAIAVLEEALRVARASGRKRTLQQVTALLARALHQHGRHAEAFETLEAAHVLEREVFSEDTERKMRHLSAQFELERTRTEAQFHRERHEAERVAREHAQREVELRTRELERLALHDSLTGLPNRVLFGDRLERALQAAAAGGSRLAVGLIDLNGFKFINDSLGHSVGDVLLSEVARRVTPVLRDGDTLARMGGDEFLVLLEHATHPEVVRSVGQRIHRALEAPFTLGGQEIFVNASAGFALYPEHAATTELLLQFADQAMYSAKRRGTSFEIYREQPAELPPVISLESALYRAQQRDELELHYQAVFSPQGALLGAEALLRWQHPQFGWVSPAQFIPIAERTGLIVPIGAWVLETACREAATWPGERGVAVNLSARQFTQSRLADQVRVALKRSGLAPRRLTLELTESLLVEHPEAARRTLGLLKALGVRVVIDDFGTGHSSLGQLKRFPVDGLKIDRSFIQDLGQSSGAGQDEAIVRAVVQMSQALGLSVTAEGVETEAQQAFLASLNVTALQGFLLARPESAARFRERAALSAR